MKKQSNILLSIGAALAMVFNVAVAHADAGYVNPVSEGGDAKTKHTYTFPKGTKFYKPKGNPGKDKPKDCKGAEIVLDDKGSGTHGGGTFKTGSDGKITCTIIGTTSGDGFIWEN